MIACLPACLLLLLLLFIQVEVLSEAGTNMVCANRIAHCLLVFIPILLGSVAAYETSQANARAAYYAASPTGSPAYKELMRAIPDVNTWPQSNVIANCFWIMEVASKLGLGVSQEHHFWQVPLSSPTPASSHPCLRPFLPKVCPVAALPYYQRSTSRSPLSPQVSSDCHSLLKPD
jgi:hypothetical protein